MTSIKFRFAGNALPLLVLLAVTFLIYQPGLYGDYIFDDLSNITTNSALEIKELTWPALRDAAMSSFSGPLKRPVSMLTFAFNASTTGFGAPLFFKLTGLIIHLGTGLAVFWLAGLLLARFRSRGSIFRMPHAPDWTRLLITGIWLLHPLNLSSVLYIVQRMTSLSALFAFLAVAVYCKARERLEQSQSYSWALIGAVFLILLPLSVLSKENGVLIPILLLVVELTAFDYKKLGRADRLRLGSLGVLTVVIPGILILFGIFSQDYRLVGSYAVRDFDMFERLLTQGRVLWFYIGMTLLPSTASLGLYHDDLLTSTGLFTPITTLLSLGGLIGLVVMALMAWRRIPVITFGIFWFLGGHLLESTFLPLEMVHEHRNYLPIFGLIFAACYLAMNWTRFESNRRLMTFAMTGYMLLMGIVTILRAEQWGDNFTHAVREAENHPNSERAQLQLGRILMLMMNEQPRVEYYVAAKEAFEKSAQLSKVNIGAHISLVQLAFLTQQPFDPAILTSAKRVLASGAIPPSAAGAFHALVNCQIYAYCKLPDEEVTRLAEAALTNPHGTPGVTSQIAIYLVQYQIDKMGNGDLAVLTLKKALERDPKSAPLNLTAGRVYRVVGEFERSAESLERATRFDSVGTYQTAISEEREKLMRDRNKSRG